MSEQPQEGRANQAVRALLAAALGIPRNSITLTRGTRSKEKSFAVDGLERDTILARLQEYSATIKRS